MVGDVFKYINIKLYYLALPASELTTYPNLKKLQSKGLTEDNQIALVTLFERRQLVQTLTLFGVPLTRAFTLLTLAFHVLFDLLWEWLTLIPKATPLPQISHLAIYMHLLNFYPFIKQKLL